jgi:beta-N-acetylhexosaminidase
MAASKLRSGFRLSHHNDSIRPISNRRNWENCETTMRPIRHRYVRPSPIRGFLVILAIAASHAAVEPSLADGPYTVPQRAAGQPPSVVRHQQRAGHDQPERSEQAWVDAALGAMTLDEKIGQLIVPATVGMFLSQDTDAFREIKRNITEFHVGGYHVLGDTSRLHDPAGAALLINHMQALARVPLLITADFEGGVGYRYQGATRLPRAMAIGATGSEDLSYQAGRIAGEEARAIGVNVNFYPVVDVNNNPRNPIINIRSFGGDPKLVSRMARAYIRGFQGTGGMATAKHFPGHGDTSTDSHLELPSIDADRSRLDEVELPPFRAAIQEGVAGVMSAHIALPRVEAEGLPATLSKKMLTDLLRHDLGFAGIVFTDAMTMRGIAAHYPDGEAAVRAFEAGADVILYPTSIEIAFSALKQAAISGRVSATRLDESVRRILGAKARLGLDKNRFTDMGKLDQLLGSAEHQMTADKIIEAAITLVRNEGRILPLKVAPEKNVLLITMVDNTEGWYGLIPGSTFSSELTRRHPKTTVVSVSDRTSPAEFEMIKQLASMADIVITCGFIRVAAYKGSIDLSAGEVDLLKTLSKLKSPFAFVLYGSPYLLSFVPELPTYVLTYEYYPGAEVAALKAILGEIKFRGKLPIELPGMYPLGYQARGLDQAGRLVQHSRLGL